MLEKERVAAFGRVEDRDVEDPKQQTVAWTWFQGRR
jgi:hypothetical protein